MGKKSPFSCCPWRRQKLPKDGAANHHAFHDVGSASPQLTFEANSRPVRPPMAGFDANKAREVFGFRRTGAGRGHGHRLPGDSQRFPISIRERELVSADSASPSVNFFMTGTWGILLVSRPNNRFVPQRTGREASQLRTMHSTLEFLVRHGYVVLLMGISEQIGLPIHRSGLAGRGGLWLTGRISFLSPVCRDLLPRSRGHHLV